MKRNLVRSIIDTIVLPKEITAFEAAYLRRMNRIGIVFFALHVPVMMLLAWANDTKPLLALALTGAIVVGPALAYFTLKNPRTLSILYGIAAMFMGGALVHFGQGPVQIEMHFYFFALIAMLAVFGNPLAILAAAVTVALHHLALWFVMPSSVFNYDAPVWVVAVHAAFVVLESIAACFIARSFFDNVIGLEKIVRKRTVELDERNRDMRLVLDNVGQGFATIDRDGLLSAERSRSFDRWFDAPQAGETLFDVMSRSAPDFGELSSTSWSQVTDGFLPLDLALAQMPRDLTIGAYRYQMAYLPIGDAEHFLVVMTDVTAVINEERAERDRKEAMILFERLLADRRAVNDFIDEGNALMNALVDGRANAPAVMQRMLHTLKGNSAIFGIMSMSDMCHELESLIAEEGTLPPHANLERLNERWREVAASVERWLGAKRRVIEIDSSEHAALERAVRDKQPQIDLLGMVRNLKLEPTERRLEHFGEQARRIAGRLDKNVAIELEGNDLRIDPKHWGGFWSSFIHAVRNAVDHGIEQPDDRIMAGKPEHGRISLRTYLRGDRFVVAIADDGRGLDWNALKERAIELGLAVNDDTSLEQAVFCDGVSTAARVTDISGRGLGMGALRDATRALGGDVEIETAPGKGTTLRMVLPTEAMAPMTVHSIRPNNNRAMTEQMQ